jgi:hypothetical protein
MSGSSGMSSLAVCSSEQPSSSSESLYDMACVTSLLYTVTASRGDMRSAVDASRLTAETEHGLVGVGVTK